MKKNRTQEVKYYGFHACLKLWKARPQDIIRLYVDQSTAKQVAPLLKWCASQKKAYHIITSEEMAAVSQSVHHEGLCILAHELPLYPFDQMLRDLKTINTPLCLLYLDGVQNPHNTGSIMRVCAHFGVPYLLGDQTSLHKNLPFYLSHRPRRSRSRQTRPLITPQKNLSQLVQKGFQPVATCSHKGTSLYEHTFSPHTLLIMGSESQGISKKLSSIAKKTVLIPGTGLVESLNVSVATGLILGEYWRQQHTA